MPGIIIIIIFIVLTEIEFVILKRIQIVSFIRLLLYFQQAPYRRLSISAVLLVGGTDVDKFQSKYKTGQAGSLVVEENRRSRPERNAKCAIV